MFRAASAFAILMASAIALSACVVEAPARYGARGPGCRWVPEHVGPAGRLIPGHCV